MIVFGSLKILKQQNISNHPFNFYTHKKKNSTNFTFLDDASVTSVYTWLFLGAECFTTTTHGGYGCPTRLAFLYGSSLLCLFPLSSFFFDPLPSSFVPIFWPFLLCPIMFLSWIFAGFSDLGLTAWVSNGVVTRLAWLPPWSLALYSPNDKVELL